MSLCDLCKNIPWEDLPTVPPDLPWHATGHEYIQPVVNWPKGVRGHPHYQSLSALRQSASVCDLCKLIRASAENVEKQLEELKPKWEAGEMRQYDWPTWEMWLVKRREGGDGCWVMSFVDRERGGNEMAYIISALGLCVREGDTLQSVIAGRPVEGSANSLIVIGRARKWLDECDTHHSCKPSKTLLPSRVIDVGHLGSSQVRLWEPVPEGTTGEYISLSYCWGTSREFTTTRATIEERKKGIIIADIPKTYQDAVKLTRELGIRYLWVDALCICQDEHADWERESAKMLSTYSNAYLTISASRAKESSGGFLGKRLDRPLVGLEYSRGGLQGKALAFSLPLREELHKNHYITLPDEPLSKRAWGLQERVLSHRVLLYGTSQMFYECNEGYHGEDGLYVEGRHDCAHKGLKLNERAKHNVLEKWYNLLWLYGPKQLSHASDKLPAISGIASLYAEGIGGGYLAGLWRDQLIEGLMWQSLSYRRVSEYRAPSWSWASGDGIPATSKQNIDYDEIAEIMDVNVTLKGSNPFGEVTDGWIKLRAPMVQLYMILDNWDPEAPGHHPYDNNIRVRTEKGNPKGTYSRFDFAFTADDAPQEAKKIAKSLEGVDIFSLVILKACSWDRKAADDEGTYHSLIVKKVDGRDVYQRLGFLIVDKKTLGQEPEKQPKEEFSTITLV